MNALDVLKRDHKAAEQMYEAYKKANSEAREAMEGKIFKALTVHEKMEDDHFYPALSEVLKDDPILEDMKKEQGELEMKVLGIRALTLFTEKDEKIKDMLETVIAHAKKEEADIFPRAEEALGAEKLEQLGMAMEPDSAVANEE